jgi:hypothetical protein
VAQRALQRLEQLAEENAQLRAENAELRRRQEKVNASGHNRGKTALI